MKIKHYPIKSALYSALTALTLAVSPASFAEVVELSPNELKSAYIKDSTIYIPKSTQQKVNKKVVNAKVIPGGKDPDQYDRDQELNESASQTATAALQVDQTWEADRLNSSLQAIDQANTLPTNISILPPREIPGAPDGFELPDNFSYTAQDLINLGFTDPRTGQALAPVSDSGILYGNNYAVGSDGTNGTLKITLPADFNSRIPPGGINSDILSINQDLQNAINMRLQLPQQGN